MTFRRPVARTVAGLIDPLYNGIVGFVFLVWMLGRRYAGRGKTRGFVQRYRLLVAVPLWSVFLALAIAFVAEFGYFADIHDIDDAVEAAAQGLMDGVNPYSEPIVPRFEKRYSPEVGWTYGTYNYLPLDLLVYTSAMAVLGALGSPVWFVAVNLAFGVAAWTILRPLVRTRLSFYVPVAGTVSIFYAFDNAMLTLLLMTAALYVSRRGRFHPRILSMLLLAAAGLTKAYALLPFGIMALFELQNCISTKDRSRLTEALVAFALALAIAVTLLVPFGTGNVLDSALLFHTSPESREGTSTGGTLLSEVMDGSESYALVALGVLLVPILIGLRLRSDLERVVLASIVFMLVIPKSSFAPLTVPGLFLALWLRERADAVASSHGLTGAICASVAREASDRPGQAPSDSRARVGLR